MKGLTCPWNIILVFVCMVSPRKAFSSGPVFTEEPPSALYLVDSSRGIMLTCSGDGNPRPTVQWLDQNYQPITRISGYREILSNGSLYLLPFSKDDYRSEIHSGIYMCSLTNRAGTVISRECRIKSDDSLPYKLQVSGVFVTRSNTAMIKCSPHNSVHRELTKVMWSREDDSTSERTIIEPDDKYSVTSEGDLLVKHVTDSDANAKYYCQITNKLTGKSIQSQAGQIILVEPQENLAPRIEHTSPSEVSGKVGEKVDLFCLAKGIPSPTYKWYREVGNLLQEIRSSSMLMSVQDSLLHFPKVLQSDSSNYVCVTSNSLGEDRKKFKLTVTSEIIVFVRPQKQIVDSGSTATFNCSAHGGRGELSITWLKNGLPLSLSAKIDIQNKGEILVIYSVDRNDRGMYQCFVRSEDESAQNSAELILGAVAPELKFVFSEQTLQPGGSVSLKCVATGNPHARVLWLLDGGLLYPQGDYILGSYMDNNEDVVSHLNISNTRVEHGGLYSCIARNILGSVQHSAMLNVHGSPVSRPMMNLTVESGVNVYLRCPASGYPISSTTWQFGGKQLPFESRHRVFSNGTLLIRQVVGQKDQGEFTCTIKNQNDQSAVGRLFLTVMEPPDVQPFQFDSDLKEGNRAHVSCAIKSGDLPMEFTWRKDGRSLPPDPDVQQQNLQFVSNLLFSRLSARHAGYYTCIVSNIVAVANYTAHLRIKVSPVWTVEPQDTAVKYGQLAVLNCQASGFPIPTITWLKSSDKDKTSFAEIETRSDIMLANNGSLIIQSAERHHEGYYQCNAKNDIGRTLTKTIFLNINVPAHFRVKTLNQSGIAGEKMVLSCEAEGDQPLKVTWNSPPPAPIQTRQSSNGMISELHLKYLSRSYAGTYMCSATNSYGYDYMSIHLSVKELPEMPQNVDVTDIESRTLKFSWDEVPGPIDYYLLQYREENTVPWQNATINGDTLSVRIADLQPSATYIVRLFAVNELGRSEPSKLLTVSTLEEAPSGPPTNVEVNVEENTLIVQWQPPHDENTNGAISGYEIEYRETGSSNIQRKMIKGPRMSIRLTGLKYFTSYEVTVKAFNKVGVGPATLPIQQITMESVPSQAPQKIKCTADSSESLRLQWNAPAHDFHNGNIQGYKIFYKPANPDLGMKNMNKVKKTIGLDMSLTNLEKYTNYSVRVLAYTRIGDGARSPPIYCHTAEDLPEAPANIKALVMTSDSILIAWNPPIKANGIIIKYHVYIEYPERKVHKEVVYGEQKNLKHIYRNLREGVTYTFWVVASTSVGEGPPSNKVVQKPATKVPARISTFSSRVITKIGTRISLDCSAVGLPSPTRTWRGPHTSSLFTSKTTEQIVWFGPVTENDAGNYTCEAENVFGRDQITFHLIVLLPPPAPLLFLLSSSINSLIVSWKQFGSGGSPVTGYLLSYAARDAQNWENVELESEIENYEIKELRCGTDYQIYVQGISSVGYSTPSQTLHAKTKGTIPDIAKQNDILSVNSTSITLYLDNWPPAECTIQYFKVAYRNNSKWINVEPSRLAPESVIIGGLSAATKYTLRIVAVNEAGSSIHDYVFATRTETGGVLPIEQLMESESSFFSQVNIIIPIVSAILCVIAITACIFIIFRKKKIYEGYKSGQQTLDSNQLDHESNQNAQHQRSYMPSPIGKDNLMSTLNKDNKSIADYDVCPYATFSLPTQTTPHCVKLRSFNQQHDCYENTSIMEGHHSIPKRPKLSHIKCPPDDFNVEISCISNQQTLPIGGKSRPRAPAPVSFTSDSDSSGGKFNQRRYQQMQRDLRQPPREYDSSTESIETSPTIGRKMMANRSFMR